MNPPHAEESLISHSLRSGKELFLKFTRFLQATSKPLIHKLDPLLVALSPYYLKIKLFCVENRLVLTVAAAVLATYLIVRPRPDPEVKEKEKDKKKKASALGTRRQVMGKTFISDNS